MKATQFSMEFFFHPQIKFPIWLNADILKGPGHRVSTSFDGNQFIDEVKRMHNVVLSLGWKTFWYKESAEIYNKRNTDAMEKVLSDNHLNTIDYKDLTINFPINAGYALKSQDALKKFYENVKRTNSVAYTKRGR